MAEPPLSSEIHKIGLAKYLVLDAKQLGFTSLCASRDSRLYIHCTVQFILRAYVLHGIRKVKLTGLVVNLRFVRRRRGE